MAEIEVMLSTEVQEYYSGLYIDFQKKVIVPQNNFFQDYEMVCHSISQIECGNNLIDIGAGNCRWFNLFEHKLKKYYAIEVNESSLAQAPQNPKLIPINKNIFDNAFYPLEFINDDIDFAYFAFFLSHFTDKNIGELLNKLGPVRNLIIVDSFWGPTHREKYKSKELRDIKRRFSSTERVFIPKRFFDITDINKLIEPFGYSITKFIEGNYWFFCSAEKKGI